MTTTITETKHVENNFKILNQSSLEIVLTEILASNFDQVLPKDLMNIV